ncbi:MAG TPA: SDR family NAD(P)-dependent oxidoreductase [Candidatus Limnocylindrales bacterium]
MKLDKNFQPRDVAAAGSLRFDGVKAAIVGGTGGIGRALARLLASRGASVLVVGQTFRDAGVPGIEFLQADLSLMREAQRVASELPAETLDVVVFTTGIFAAPNRQETAEGIEKDMAVSYLSRLVIVRDIAPRLGTERPQGAPKPRVFVMGFPGAGNTGTLDDLNAEKSYKAMAVHMNTVAGNEMIVLDAVNRYPQMNFFGLNPGLIKTDIRSNFLGAGSVRHRLTEWLIGHLAPSADDYAQRIAPLLVSPDLEGRSGTMFDRKGRAILPSPKLTGGHIDAFMSASRALVAVS